MTGGMWYLRSRFANPTQLANFVLARIRKEPAAAEDAVPYASPRGDRPVEQRRTAQLRR
jgi:hypothetical protein